MEGAAKENANGLHNQTEDYRFSISLPPSISEATIAVDVVVVRSFERSNVASIPRAATQPVNATKSLTNEKPSVTEIVVDEPVSTTPRSTRPIPKITISIPQGSEEFPNNDDIKRSYRTTRDPGRNRRQSTILAGSSLPGGKDDGFLDAKKLASHLHNARVLLFEYAENLVWKERLIQSSARIADSLRQEIVKARANCPSRPIIFVSDDFGVVVVQRCLMRCAEDIHWRDIVCWVTIGIVLLRTLSGHLVMPALSSRNPFKLPDDPAEVLEMFKKLANDLQDRLSSQTPTAKAEANSQSRPTRLERIRSHPSGTSKSNNSLKHAENFGTFYHWHADWRPAMKLVSMTWNDRPRDYDKMAYVVQTNLDAYRLLLMAQSGEAIALRTLLERVDNVDISVQDGLNRSALHLAVRDCHLGTLNVLRDKGDATFFSLSDVNGRNALHYAAMYCQDLKKLRKMVDILVEGGINLDAVDNNRISARQAATDRHALPQLLQRFRGPSRGVPVLPKPKQPDLAASEACRGFRATLANFYSDANNEEQVSIQQPSVYDLLYQEDGGSDEFFKTQQQMSLDGSREFSNVLQFQWYHLPVNHLGWVKDLFARMKIVTDPLEYDQHDGEAYWSRYMRPQARNFHYERYASQTDSSPISPSLNRLVSRGGAKDFVLFLPFLNFERQDILEDLRNATNENLSDQAKKLLGGRQKAALRPQSSSDDPTSPITDTEVSGGEETPVSTSAPNTLAPQVARRDSIDANNANIGTWNSVDYKMRPMVKSSSKVYDLPDVEEKLIRSYLVKESSQFHQRRTLDQSHYPMLRDTSKRDDDQVVLRRQRGRWLGVVNQKEVAEEPHQLVMVDQLWIWVIDNTIVTSFPQKWRADNFEPKYDVLQQLLLHLRKTQRPCIPNVHELAEVIINFCVNIFNTPSPRAKLSLHGLFEKTVGDIADHQMTLFRRFEKEMDKLSHSRTGKIASLDMNQMFAIEEDIKLLDEIRDTRDELNMLLRIFNDQAMAVKDMLAILDQGELARRLSSQSVGGARRTGTNDTTDSVVKNNISNSSFRSEKRIEQMLKKQYGVIDVNTRDFTRMLTHAETSYEEADSLLDLKQKQLNVLEARVARRGADTILVFTAATIMFGSLSFITAFFTLNIAAFPHRLDVTVWDLGDVVGLVVAISSGLALLFIIIAFQFNNLVRVANKLLRPVGLGWEWFRERVPEVWDRFCDSVLRTWIWFYARIFLKGRARQSFLSGTGMEVESLPDSDMDQFKLA